MNDSTKSGKTFGAAHRFSHFNKSNDSVSTANLSWIPFTVKYPSHYN